MPPAPIGDSTSKAPTLSPGLRLKVAEIVTAGCDFSVTEAAWLAASSSRQRSPTRCLLLRTLHMCGEILRNPPRGGSRVRSSLGISRARPSAAIGRDGEPEGATVKRASLVAAGILVAATGCRRREPPPPDVPEVEVTPVVQRDVPVVSEWIATLDGSVNADIRPKIEGYLLRHLYKEGQLVQAGTRLFEIDPRQFRASLGQAQGALGQTEAQLAKTKKD